MKKKLDKTIKEYKEEDEWTIIFIIFFCYTFFTRSFNLYVLNCKSKIKFIAINFIMPIESKDVCYNVYYNLSTERKLVVKIKTTQSITNQNQLDAKIIE